MKIKRFVRFLLLMTSASLLSACSIETEKCSDVNQDRIYQYLSATYDAEADSTSASAKLTFGGASGTTLQMVENCSIEHDSIDLDETKFLGTSYEGSKSGMVATHTFTFTDNQSRDYVNSGTIKSTAFSSPPSTVTKAGGTVVNFTGGALAAGESVTLTLSKTVSAEGGGTTYHSTSVSEDDDGATSLTIPASNIETMPTGTTEMTLRRTVETAVTEGTEVGGYLYMHYDTAPINVEITD